MDLTINDFEVVPDPNCGDGCEKCFFQDFEGGCFVLYSKIGIELEEKHGSCFDDPEHYYKLKTKE